MIDIFIVDGTVNGFDKPTYNWGEHASLNRKVFFEEPDCTDAAAFSR